MSTFTVMAPVLARQFCKLQAPPFHTVPCTGVPPGLTARTIATPLKADAWDKALAGHPNPELVGSTLNRHAARVPHWHSGVPSVQGQFKQHLLGTRAQGGGRPVYAHPAGEGIWQGHSPTVNVQKSSRAVLR